VSRLQAVNDCFQSLAITFRANRECRVSTLMKRAEPTLDLVSLPEFRLTGLFVYG
jgi:hypothetical protein